MSIRDEIIGLVQQNNVFSNSVVEETHLYQDLHYDSLSFINLLLKLEELYDIVINMSEMESCLEVGRLVDLVEKKVRGKHYA